MRFRFINAEKAEFPLWLLCKVMGVSVKGFYSWRERGEKVETDHSELDDAVRNVHLEHKRRYGSRRIKDALADDGARVAG
jgi:putative transposase